MLQKGRLYGERGIISVSPSSTSQWMFNAFTHALRFFQNTDVFQWRLRNLSAANKFPQNGKELYEADTDWLNHQQMSLTCLVNAVNNSEFIFFSPSANIVKQCTVIWQLPRSEFEPFGAMTFDIAKRTSFYQILGPGSVLCRAATNTYIQYIINLDNLYDWRKKQYLWC